MTRFFVVALIGLVICIVLKSQAQTVESNEKDPTCMSDRRKGSEDEAESLSPKEDSEVSAPVEDTDRTGAQAYASVTRPKSSYRGPPVKFVNCFACVDCPKAMANTTAKYCPYTNDPSKTNKCVVYAEQYIQLKKLWYVRGCASERGSCDDIRRGHENTPSVKLSFCSECEGDRCNGVSRSISDLTTGLLFLVLCPVLGKYTLS